MNLTTTRSNERRRKMKMMKELEIDLWIESNCSESHKQKLIKNTIMLRLINALKQEEDFNLTNLLELLQEFLMQEDNVDKSNLEKVSSLFHSLFVQRNVI